MKRTVVDREIDARIAILLDMSTVSVGDVTHIFFDELMKHLLDGNEVHISGFGTFKVVERKGKRQSITRLNKSSNFKGNSVGETLVEVRRKFYVSFRRAKAFQARFSAKYGKNKVHHEKERMKNMEKYGVDETGSEQEKVASQGCPVCGRKCERHGDVIACPTHGTEPFEKQSKE